MELTRVQEIENAIAHNELSPAQVFTQMKQLVYREAPCYAFCEGKAFKSNIKSLEAKIDQLRAELEHEIQRSEFYKGEFLCRKGNSVALEKFDKFKAEIKADAIREAMRSIIDKWQVSKDHASVLADSGYVYVSNRALDEYAEKVRRGEV